MDRPRMPISEANAYDRRAPMERMGFTKHAVNGAVSLVISVAATVAMADDGGNYDLWDLVLSVAVSAFLSGFFTSYFAGE